MCLPPQKCLQAFIAALMLKAAALSCMASPSPAAKTLQSELQHAIDQGESSFTIKPGRYVFENSTFGLQNAKDMVVEGSGATLIFYIGFGMQLSHCHNITVQNLIIDYEPENYAQGWYQKPVPGDSHSFVATFDDRFLMPDPNLSPPFRRPGGLVGAKVGFWNASTYRLAYQGNQFFNHSVNVSGGDPHTYQIVLDSPMQGNPQPGMLVTIWPRIGSTYLVNNGSMVTTRNVTLHAAGNMGFVEQGGQGRNRYQSCGIVRRPQPPGQHLPPPMLACNADGFHSNSVDNGPTVEGCEISFTGDDFLNIHNRMEILFGCDSSRTHCYVNDVQGGDMLQRVRVGDVLSIFQINTLHLFGKGQVQFIQQTSNASILAQARKLFDELNGPTYKAGILRPFSIAVFEVRFDSSLPANTTDIALVNFDKDSNAGGLVQNNHFHDGYSRVILMKSINGTVINNRLARAAGVHVAAEQPWLEGSLGLRNVLVANNTLQDCGTHPIQVGPETHNVTVVNNTILPPDLA